MRSPRAILRSLMTDLDSMGDGSIFCLDHAEEGGCGCGVAITDCEPARTAAA